jgi:hypothetical protein
MSTHDYTCYEFKKSFNPVTRFLWKCAGADLNIMPNCSGYDHVKYACLGGIVLATGALAFIAMTFAISIIFPTETINFTEKGEKLIEPGTPWFIPVIIGLIWGLIIFNLDRFIISSTGKGDGTETITWRELGNAVPRLAMAIIIGFTISAPLEVYMFNSEIQKQFARDKQEEMDGRAKTIELSFKGEIDKYQKDINILENEKNGYEAERLKDLDGARRENSTEKGGCGPKCEEYKRFAAEEQAKIDKVDLKIKAIQANQDLIKGKQEKQKSELKAELMQKPGLLESIITLDNVEGSGWPTWFLRLLFIVVETSPVFFKLMLTKSSYDYLNENLTELIKAKHGIQVQHLPFKDDNGKAKEKQIITFYDGKIELEKRRKLLQSQKELSDYLVDKWEKAHKDEIDKNPNKYFDDENKG